MDINASLKLTLVPTLQLFRILVFIGYSHNSNHNNYQTWRQTFWIFKEMQLPLRANVPLTSRRGREIRNLSLLIAAGTRTNILGCT